MSHSKPWLPTRPFIAGWLQALLLLSLCLAAWPAPAQAVPAPAAARAPIERHAAPWWEAFDDPVLRRLMDGANATPDRQAALFRSYVELQVGALRFRIARQIEALAQQQRQWVEQSEAGAEGRDQLLELLARRSEHVAAVLSTLDQENQQRLTVLAALKGMDPGPMTTLLTPADGTPRVPLVGAAVPEPSPTLAVHNEPGESPRSQALRMLGGAAERASRAQQLLQATRLNLDALKLRHEAGAADALAVMAGQLELLMQADQYVKAAGALAVAWAQWLQLGGGSGLAQAASR